MGGPPPARPSPACTASPCRPPALQTHRSSVGVSIGVSPHHPTQRSPHHPTERSESSEYELSEGSYGSYGSPGVMDEDGGEGMWLSCVDESTLFAHAAEYPDLPRRSFRAAADGSAAAAADAQPPLPQRVVRLADVDRLAQRAASTSNPSAGQAESGDTLRI